MKTVAQTYWNLRLEYRELGRKLKNEEPLTEREIELLVDYVKMAKEEAEENK